jgi:hypothetical protein
LGRRRGTAVENLKEAWPTFADSGQNAPSEYRFVFDLSGFRKRFRKAILFYKVLLFLFILNTLALFFFFFTTLRRYAYFYSFSS